MGYGIGYGELLDWVCGVGFGQNINTKTNLGDSVVRVSTKDPQKLFRYEEVLPSHSMIGGVIIMYGILQFVVFTYFIG